MSLDDQPVRIRGRLSDRVPFGTGAALTDICAVEYGQAPFQPYDQGLFEGLAHWLSALQAFVAAPDMDELRLQVQSLQEPLGSALLSTLLEMNAFDAVDKASHQVSGSHLHRRLMEWNDAFRTMKLIHGLRDKLAAPVP